MSAGLAGEPAHGPEAADDHQLSTPKMIGDGRQNRSQSGMGIMSPCGMFERHDIPERRQA
jgi:hypothetical protein